jgi:hypothetical protein
LFPWYHHDDGWSICVSLHPAHGLARSILDSHLVHRSTIHRNTLLEVCVPHSPHSVPHPSSASPCAHLYSPVLAVDFARYSRKYSSFLLFFLILLNLARGTLSIARHRILTLFPILLMTLLMTLLLIPPLFPYSHQPRSWHLEHRLLRGVVVRDKMRSRRSRMEQNEANE